jgi:hypothetical protein
MMYQTISVFSDGKKKSDAENCSKLHADNLFVTIHVRRKRGNEGVEEV